VTFILTCISS